MGLNLGVILRESAARHPDRAALVAAEAPIPYARLDAAARRLAGGLYGLRVRAGEHVALLLPNVPHFSIAYFGSHYAGAPVVPLDPALPPEAIAYHLRDANAAVLVTWEDQVDCARVAVARTPTCRHLIVAKRNPTDPTAPPGATSMNALLAGAPPVSDLADTQADDTAAILYTAGTTGRPKGAELSHLNLLFHAEVLATRRLSLDASTVALAVLPLFRGLAQTVAHNAVMMAGGTVVLLPQPEPQAVLQVMHQHRVTLLTGDPAVYGALLHHPRARAYDLGALRCGVSGGAPMPAEILRAFEQKHGVRILEAYGSSETTAVACLARPEDAGKPGCVGVPLWGVAARLVDEGGGVVEAPGTAGELLVKGHNVMKGYYGRPEASEEALRDGWLHTGDLAIRDGDGSYRIVGRKGARTRE
ncbi:MAG: AMP-binding protein [Myxococcota bacterium]